MANKLSFVSSELDRNSSSEHRLRRVIIRNNSNSIIAIFRSADGGGHSISDWLPRTWQCNDEIDYESFPAPLA